MKVEVDEDTCIGCGLCVEICPDVFEMGKDMKSHTKVKKVPDKLKAKVKEAAQSCPVQAIKVSD